MHSDSFMRSVRALGAFVFSAALAGCFGTGDGPEPIAGTPAPPPPPSLCDPATAQGDGAPFPVFFENLAGSYDFGMDAGFGGGATVVVENPVCSAENTTPQVARYQKFAAEPFGGSTLQLGTNVDFTPGEAFTVKVWSQRAVPFTFKFEDAISGDPALGIERVESHSGSAEWETLCFDFSGATAGFTTSSITLIFDNGVVGNADNDPDNWTFYLDAIEQVDVCPGAPTTTLPVDFEADPATYQFANFAGGEADVIANPDQTGSNTTSQTARMRKFADQVFGGTTLSLAGNVDFTQGTAFTMQVWSPRAVPVLFKYEDAITGDPNAGIEVTENHPGGSEWQELCFDFGASANGFTSSAITFIFDGAAVGDAENDPTNWTFYFDEIQQVADCSGGGGTPPASFAAVTFDDPAVTYALRGFGGAEDSTVVADPDDAGNSVAQVNRSATAETFAGTVVSTGPNESLGAIPLDASNTQMTLRVRAPAAGIPVRLKIENSGDPAISVETEVLTTVANTWETLTFDFTNEVSGTAAFDPAATYDKAAIFFNFGTDGATAGAQTYFFDDLDVVGAMPPATSFETITFDDSAVTYTLRGFGGAEDSTVQADPDDAGNNVTQVNRSAAAETFAGTVVSTGANESVPDIPLDAMNTTMTMRVRSPAAGIPVRFKIENAGDPAISVETETLTTAADTWETLTFDFSNEVSGTAAFNPASTYNKIAIFFNFGTDGATAGAQTFYFDDIAVGSSGGGGGSGVSDFESGTATFSDFGGGVATVISNPDATGINTSAQVGQMQKFAGETFGGSTLQLPSAVMLADGDSYLMKVRAQREVVVTLKLEPQGDERTATHSGSGTWEELCFDFTGVSSASITGLTVIFDNGTAGDAANDPDAWTFQFDDIQQTSNACPTPPPPPAASFETITFDDSAVTYDLRGFGGAEDSTVQADPDDAGNNVVQVNRSATAETFAGTVVSTGANESVPDIPLDAMNTTMTMRVRSPAAGIPVRFKIENAGDPAISVETETLTTAADTWETLTFDFSNEVSGTAAFNPASTYNKIAIFFNFGTDGATAGAQTFYFDDIAVPAPPPPPPAFETITFDDSAVTYDLRGFGGAEDSTVQADPDDAGNNVVQVNRSATAETFAGTVVSTGANESVPDIPLDAMNTTMTMRVRSPAAGIPVRFKIENAGDPAISVETETLTTAADTWETLTFDFSNEVSGTAAFNPASTYNKIAIFFNFGTDGATAGAQTFYFDDIAVGSSGGGGGSGVSDFESGTATFSDFGGGVATVISNPDATGINTSAQVGQMQKFAGETFGGSTLQLPSAVMLADGDSYLMKVRAQREVVVTLKLEPQGDERTATHSGSGTWEELCFDFTGVSSASITGLTVIFDNGTAGDAANDPDAWTFQFDDIQQTSNACPTPPPPPAFETITFDDSGTTYTLTDFGGNASTVTNDPAGGMNQVVQSVRSASAATFAGTTVSTLPGDQIAEPLTASNLVMTARVYSPEAGVTVRLKIEDASNPAIFIETDTTTTAVNTWETLSFDFGSPAGGSFDPANTYNRISIFFNFGVDGATAGEQTYFFDDIAVAPSGPGGGGMGELAVNGGFESGDLTGWTTFDNGGTITVVSSDSTEGTFSVNAVAGPGQNPVLKLEFLAEGVVTPGQTVNISFDMRGSAADGGVIFPELISEEAMGASGELLETIAAPPAAWTNFSYTPQAGADVTRGITFQIAVVCGGAPTCSANVFIDNVSITLDSGT